MADKIGNVDVPEIAVSAGAFPLVSDFPFGRAQAPQVAVHQFGSGNAKIEQRFYLGDGAKRFRVVRQRLTKNERIALRDFWEDMKGPYGAFPYHAPNEDGTTTDYTCRFDAPDLAWDMTGPEVSSVDITLVEIPSATPEYTLNSSQARFPSGALPAALLAQVQTLIPLMKILPRETAYPAIYLSDRRCKVGAQVYLARLLDWDGIDQSTGDEADQARFVFGNADRVMRDLANDTDLWRAALEFSLFHVGTGIKLDLWKGEITDWSLDAGPEFPVTAADGVYDLRLPYPRRRVSRTCGKDLDGDGCPFASAGALDLAHFPEASADVCDKGLDTPNGCMAHGMKRYYGAQIVEPQDVRLRQGSVGPGFTKWGFVAPAAFLFTAKSKYLTTSSIVNDTIYDKPIPEVYTDIDFPVNCLLATGREEDKYYDALGVVCEGPIGDFAADPTKHRLDGQSCHGPGSMGLRTGLGSDPAGASDWFSLGQTGDQRGGDWRKAYNGSSTFKDNFAAGTAFMELRRMDESGIQPTRPSDHQMVAVVSSGMKGYTWTDSGDHEHFTRNSDQVLTNPVWIAVNMLLRAKGVWHAGAATQEQYFDVKACADSTVAGGFEKGAALICDLGVVKMPGMGVGAEPQFRFRGIIQEEKPLRDWIQEILTGCLGYYTFSFGKFRPGIRVSSSVVEAFTSGNILFNSLRLSPVKAAFNRLTASFADEEFDYAQNTVDFYDADHRAKFGESKQSINLVGCFSKSQAMRVTVVRTREELGGVTEAEWKAARNIAVKTTILALNVEPGMVCSMEAADMPGGAGEFRVQSWRLNKDYSIDLQGRTTTDSMYDLTTGPKPADVAASPVPVELHAIPRGLNWHPYEIQPGASDPLYGEQDWTFGLGQEYEILADGTAQANLVVTGKLPVNSFLANVNAPEIRSGVQGAGGAIAAGTVYVAVCGKDATGKLTPPSNILAVPVTGVDKKITISSITWPVGTLTGYVVFAATTPTMLCKQAEADDAKPATIELAGLPARSSWGLPSPYSSFIRAKAKRLIHAGVAGIAIDAVGAGTLTAAGLTGGGDDYTGRIVSVIADSSDGSAAMWNFTATAYNPATGQFTLTPDPQAAGVQAGDVLIVRTTPSTFTATMIGDAKLINATAPSGMTVNVEAGNLVRIIAGTGRGQVRRIASNTATVLTVDQPFDVVPDATSRFVVEAPDWELIAESTPVVNSDSQLAAKLRMPASNYADLCALVQVVAVDSAGNESLAEEAPVREIWVNGQAGAVQVLPVTRVAADASITAVSQSVEIDTTANAVTVTMRPFSEWVGQDITFTRVSGGANNATIVVAPGSGDTFNGVSSRVLSEQWESVTIRAVE